MQTEKKTQTEMHPHFPSGEWEGFYLQFGQKYKMESSLEFKDGLVSGKGVDGIGPYIWKGKYNSEEGTCQMTKTYIGAHDVFYSGMVDENGFWGHWKINFFGEGFHLWPKKAKSKDQFQVIEQETIEVPATKIDEITIEDFVI